MAAGFFAAGFFAAGFFAAGFVRPPASASPPGFGFASAFSAVGFASAFAAGLRVKSLTSVTSSRVSSWRWPARRR